MVTQKTKNGKFDLVIVGDGLLAYKILFFAIDYFFKLSGNFGVAIILITICNVLHSFH